MTPEEFAVKVSELTRRFDAALKEQADELAAIKRDIPTLDRRLICAFVQGAKWWEWYKEGITMWASDRDIAEAQAVFRLEQGTLGLAGTVSREERT